MSVDSTQTELEKNDKFNTSCDSYDQAHDFRRKPSRQNSYLEAVKQIGGKSNVLYL